jgi:DNA-binding transcriptional regulator YiaG
MAIATITRNEYLLNLVAVRTLASSGRARGIRISAGLSLADVGGAIGVTAATVQRWENGLRKPYGEAALRYGALLQALARQAAGCQEDGP